MNLEKEIFEISLVDIMPNRFQPREIFDDEGLKELSESIRAHGVIQPIIVRKVGDKYEIIAGERRYRASQLAGKQTIPALVRDIDDKEAAKIALLENLQRRDLTPIEEAKTYQTILKLDNITQDELARNLGKSQSAIANKLRLLNLDEEVQTALLNSQISERHARSLLNIDMVRQKELLHRITNERLTVRQVDEEILRLTGKMPEEIPEEQNNIELNNPYPTNNIITKEPPVNDFLNPIITNNNNDIPTPIIPEFQTNQEPSNIISDINNIPTSVTAPNDYQEIQNEQSEPILPETEKPIIDNQFNNKIELSEEPKSKNIFDSLRVTPDNESSNYDNVYDLRFAINNFRQAVQNTEKFGFKVNVEETDNENTYQIVINIDKNNKS